MTLAEDGDTIALPAAAPYELTLPASAFPNPFEPWRESGTHLRIVQPLMTIRGPASGGTAVIR